MVKIIRLSGSAVFFDFFAAADASARVAELAILGCQSRRRQVEKVSRLCRCCSRLGGRLPRRLARVFRICTSGPAHRCSMARFFRCLKSSRILTGIRGQIVIHSGFNIRSSTDLKQSRFGFGVSVRLQVSPRIPECRTAGLTRALCIQPSIPPLRAQLSCT